MGELLGRAAAPAAERASGDGECLGGWGEGGREGLICPPSCSNKRRPPARTAHAGRGRSEGEPVRPRARAPARAHKPAPPQGGAERGGVGWRAGRALGLADRLGRLAAGRSRQGAAGGTALALAGCGGTTQGSRAAVEVRAGAGLSLPLFASWQLPDLCFFWAAAVWRILTRKKGACCYFGDRFFLFLFF